MRQRLLFILIVFIAVLLSGCGGQQTLEPVTYTIEMTEYAFNPDSIEVQVGQEVTLELINLGALEHEIMFGRDVMEMGGKPSGYMLDMFEHAGVEPVVTMMEGMAEGGHEEEHSGFMVVLEKTGDTATLTFPVTKEMVGEWEMGCFELDGVHYTSGMKGVFTVTP
jgi:plastocyanin